MTPPTTTGRLLVFAAALAVIPAASLFGADAAAATTAHPADPGPGATERIEFAAGADNATVSGTFDPGADDRFVLAAEAGQTMTLTGSFGGLGVAVVAPDGSPLPGGPGDSIAFSLPATGDYLITIGPRRSEATSYSFTVTIPAAPSPAPGDAQRVQFEPGTDNATASGSVEPGATARYVLNAAAGQTLNVAVGPEQFAALTTIFGPGGDVVGSGHTTASAALPANGDYVVEIGNTGETNDYTVSFSIPEAAVSGNPACPDAQRIEFEPGADRGTVDGSLAGDDRGSYVLWAAAGQTMTIDLDSVEENADLEILDPNGAAIAEGPNGYPLTRSGDQCVAVFSEDGAQSTYTMSVVIPAPASAPTTTVACGVDPQAPAIAENLAAVPPAQQLSGASWTYLGDSNYDPCADLSYALVETEGGTGSSPQQLMLFHRGAYIGTATECAFGFTSVTDATGNSVTVEYRWPLPGDTNAAPSGSATVTFTWNGTDVVMSADLPAELLSMSGCA